MNARQVSLMIIDRIDLISRSPFCTSTFKRQKIETNYTIDLPLGTWGMQNWKNLLCRLLLLLPISESSTCATLIRSKPIRRRLDWQQMEMSAFLAPTRWLLISPPFGRHGQQGGQETLHATRVGRYPFCRMGREERQYYTAGSSWRVSL